MLSLLADHARHHADVLHARVEAADDNTHRRDVSGESKIRQIFDINKDVQARLKFVRILTNIWS